MKLYELPRGTKFKLVLDGVVGDEVYLLDHIDGMYSLCYNKDEGICHIAAYAPVEKVEDED